MKLMFEKWENNHLSGILKRGILVATYDDFSDEDGVDILSSGTATLSDKDFFNLFRKRSGGYYLPAGTELKWNGYGYNHSYYSYNVVGTKYDVALTKIPMFTEGENVRTIKEDIESKKRITEAYSNNMRIGDLLNTLKVAYSYRALDNFGGPGADPDVSILSIDLAAHFNTIEIEDICKRLLNEQERNIIRACIEYICNYWWSPDDINYYKSEPQYEILAKKYGWE